MDIEAINNEHNTITHFPDGTEIYGDFGVCQSDGEWVEIYPAEHSDESFILRPADAKALGAALLEITKEHK